RGEVDLGPKQALDLREAMELGTVVGGGVLAPWRSAGPNDPLAAAPRFDIFPPYSIADRASARSSQRSRLSRPVLRAAQLAPPAI
ncbi:hypothetical protein G9A89_015207, partial [Geosiphon pyriformis]